MGRKKRKPKRTGAFDAGRLPAAFGYPASPNATARDASAVPPAPYGTATPASGVAPFALDMLPSTALPPEKPAREQESVSLSELGAMMRDYVAHELRTARMVAFHPLSAHVVPMTLAVVRLAEVEDRGARLDRGAPTEIVTAAWSADAYTTEELAQLRDTVAKGVPRV